MNKIIGLKYFRSLVWMLVLCFTIGSNLLANHRFNHEITDFLLDGSGYSFDNNAIVINQDLAKKSESNHHSDHSDCQLCFSSLIQNQLLFFNLAVFSIFFYGFLVIFTQNYYRTKNYLNSFNLLRAPPFFS